MAATEQGTAAVTANSVTIQNSVQDLDAPMGGKMSFDVAGTFTLADEAGDPMHGYVAPSTYACGWPKADPPAYQGNYTIAVGSTIPDGLFKDGCNEVVRLHDFQGAYLVVDMSALDCGPCQSLAGDEQQFIATMATQGIDVHVITLMAPALNDPFAETSTAQLNAWSTTYGLSSPVLSDRSWGLTMFYAIYGETTGYPSWAIVAPDLEVLETGVGFTDFSGIEATISAHASP